MHCEECHLFQPRKQGKTSDKVTLEMSLERGIHLKGRINIWSLLSFHVTKEWCKRKDKLEKAYKG